MGKNEETQNHDLKHRVIVKYEQIKGHVGRHKTVYAFGAGVVLVITVVVTKRVIFPNQTAMLIKKLVIKDSVFLIQTYARRQGPPSYLIECLETGMKWSTQTGTARDIGVSPSLISSRFADTNGAVAVINGLHYVRRAMVIPRS